MTRINSPNYINNIKTILMPKFSINTMNTMNTMNNTLINIINMKGIISGMMTKSQIYGVMYYLSEVLNNKLEGNIVELGCNIGTTSIFIREILNIYNSNKEFHVYDSWEGLPKKLEQDIKSKIKK